MMEKERSLLVRRDSELATSSAELSPNPTKSRDLPELYMKTELPQDLHPSYQAIGQIENASKRPALLSASQTEPELKPITSHPSIQLGHEESIENFSPQEIYQEADLKSLTFKDSLKAYETAADPKYKTDVTLEGVNHTWHEVLDEVNSVAGQCKDKSSFWKKVRHGLRKCGENSKRFSGWLDLLPSDSEYFSIVCGGLKLIIKAADRLGIVRKSICDAIADIPAYLTTTSLVSGLFRQSKELHEASSALYIATLAALDHIVVWFRQKAAKKGLKALWQQDAYEETLTNKIAAIKSCSEKFKHAAQICSYQKQDDIQTEIKRTKSDVHVNLLAIQQSRSESLQHRRSFNESLSFEAGETRKLMGLELAKLESQNAGLETQLTNVTAELREVVKVFLGSNARINKKTHDLQEHPVSKRIPRNEVAYPEKLQEEALHRLAYESSVVAKDLESLLRIAWLLSKPAQDRAVTLMKSPKLSEWLTAPHSAILFVNGNYGTSERRSPLSFVCAKLMDSLEPSNRPPRAKGLHAHAFFCGQHLNPSDPYFEVSDMMRSLVAQLVVSHHDKFDRSRMLKLAKIDPSDVQSLCDIYYSLIAQLPSYTTVFCLIDALSFHEDNKKRCKEAQIVMETFNDLVEIDNQSEHCIFKVLLTCPGASRKLYNEVSQKRNIMWMPKKVSPQGGFTGMKWSASAGREVGELNTVNSW